MMNGLLYVYISLGVLKGQNNSDVPMTESYLNWWAAQGYSAP